VSPDVSLSISTFCSAGRRADDSVTDFHKHHPGGSTVIVANAGRDVTYVPFLLSSSYLHTPYPYQRRKANHSDKKNNG